MINKIRLNILKGAKPESFRFSSLNTTEDYFCWLQQAPQPKQKNSGLTRRRDEGPGEQKLPTKPILKKVLIFNYLVGSFVELLISDFQEFHFEALVERFPLPARYLKKLGQNPHPQ